MGNNEEAKEIQLVIEKNLPKHVGEVLQQRLAKADQDAEQLKILRDEYNDQSKMLSKTQQELSEAKRKLELWDAKSHELDAREKAVEKLELDKRIMLLQIESAEQRVNDHKEMMQTVFRVNTVRESVFTNIREDESTNDWNPKRQKNQSTDVTKTITKE